MRAEVFSALPEAEAEAEAGAPAPPAARAAGVTEGAAEGTGLDGVGAALGGDCMIVSARREANETNQLERTLPV